MKHCLWKKLQSFIIFGFWEKNSDYRWKKFNSVVGTTYYVSRRSVWQEVCFFSIDFSKPNSRSWFESIEAFDDTFLAVLLNLHSICQMDTLVKKNFCWKCIGFCRRLWTMSKYKWPLGVTNLCFLYFWRKNLVFLEEIWWFSRTEFHPSKRSLWRNF